MSDAVPVATLLLTVTNSIVEVFILCIAGYILSRTGVTDKATQRKLNVINVSLFTPALLFSKVAFSLTPAKLKEMWIIPLGFFVVTGLSAAVAYVLARMFKLKKSQRAFAMCAAMFQNSNSLPIALIQSLVVEVPGLKRDEHDTKDQMLGRALTYLVLYSTLGMMFRWSWGVRLLSAADDESDEPTYKSIDVPPPVGAGVGSQVQNNNADNARNSREFGSHIVQSPEAQTQQANGHEQNPFFSVHDAEEGRGRVQTNGHSVPSPSNSTIPFSSGPGSAHSMHQSSSRRNSSSGLFSLNRRTSSQSRSYSQSSHHRKRPTRTESGREFWGLPQFPKDRGIVLEEEDSSDDDGEPEFDSNHQPINLHRRRPSTPNLRKRLLSKAKGWGKAVHEFLTVPMYAALVSIIIAMIPPLQAFLGQLKPVEQAIRSAGSCSIPVTLVVLGAFFYTPPQPSPPGPALGARSQSGMRPIPESPSSSDTLRPDQNQGNYFERKFRALAGGKAFGNPDYPGENRTVLVAVLSRMIITPLLLLPVIAVLAKYDLFEAAEDPVFILAAVLLVSSPPALTLAQITQAASGDAFERLISKTISWSYAVLTPPLTLAYVVVGLVFGRL